MNSLNISSAACGNRVVAAFEKANAYGQEFGIQIGVEIVPWSRTNYDQLRRLEDKWNVRVESIHAAMWMDNKYRYTVRHDKMKGAEAVVAKMFAGTVESNPGIEIARRLEVPLVMHAGIWFEIQRLEQTARNKMLDRLRGLPAGVSWEAAWNRHPWTLIGNEGLGAAIAAYDQAIEAGVVSTVTLDTSHLARHLRDSSPEHGLLIAASHLLFRKIFQIHLSDILRGKTPADDVQHLELGLGDIDLKQTVSICRRQWPSANITLEVMGSRWDFVKPRDSVVPLDRSIRALVPLLQQ